MMGAISKPTGVSPIWGEMSYHGFSHPFMASHWEWFMKLAATSSGFHWQFLGFINQSIALRNASARSIPPVSETIPNHP